MATLREEGSGSGAFQGPLYRAFAGTICRYANENPHA